MSVFNRVGIQVSHGTILAYAALILILFIAFTVRILPLRWENLAAGTAYLNEFDPYYQLSLTKHMVEFGPLSPYYPTPWFDMMKWYPNGLDMSGALPSLPMTAWALYSIASVFGSFDLMTFCSILPAFIAVISCTILYLLGKDMGGRTVGLFAALFLAVAPSFLQRSSLGFFDTEVPGVLGLVLFIFLFLRSLDGNRSLKGSLFYSVGAGLALAYFIGGWGAAYYIIGLSVLFVFAMVLLRRYSQRLLISYSITFGLALFIGMQVPYLSFNYLVSAVVLLVAAGFVVLLVAELLRNNITVRNKMTLVAGSVVAIVAVFAVLAATGALTSLAGKFITVLDPFIRSASPLIDSVAEQRISAWGNLYIEMGVSILFFLVGFYFVLKKPTNRNIFLLLFGATALYFSTSMVRLLVILAPAFAIIAGIGIVGLISPFFNMLQEAPRMVVKAKRKMPRVSKEFGGIAVLVIFMLLVTSLAFSPQTGGTPRAVSQAYTPTAISASSLPVGGANLNEPITAWLDALEWLDTNAAPSDVVVMWWDYGNWLTDIGNVTSLADNTTSNSTQIENVGFAFMGNENQTLRMLSTYDQSRVKYIAVFLTLTFYQNSSSTSSSGGEYIAYPAGFADEGKWYWMARISGQAQQRFIDSGFVSAADSWANESAFGSSDQQTGTWVWNNKGLSSTVFKLLNNAEATYCSVMQAAGVNLTPDQTVAAPTYFKQAYFSGISASPSQYGGIVPIVAIYEIDWDAYNAAVGATG
ncbi:MAG: hypothetical protein NWE93_07260 [Candidatus Bathyarchaeota archaeon]|nr:hypothetical protein [Candidatus Bathyarchaeota archaeon]